jgi:hypothetical protein
VIVAVLLGGLLYFGFGGRESSAPAPVPITGPERAEEARGIIAEIEETRERSPQPSSPRTEPPAAPQASADQSAGDGAVPETPAPPAAEQGGASSELDSAFARAEAFRKSGQLADAQLLYFYAARDGHPGAAFEYASMNDPNHHSPETSLLAEPDAFQAYRWYTTALEGGVAAAEPRLDALHEWAEAAAADGDSEADRLLLQWEQ